MMDFSFYDIGLFSDFLRKLRDLMRDYERLSVADINAILHINGCQKDARYGWTPDMVEKLELSITGNQYKISFPEIIDLTKSNKDTREEKSIKEKLEDIRGFLDDLIEEV